MSLSTSIVRVLALSLFRLARRRGAAQRSHPCASRAGWSWWPPTSRSPRDGSRLPATIIASAADNQTSGDSGPDGRGRSGGDWGKVRVALCPGPRWTNWGMSMSVAGPRVLPSVQHAECGVALRESVPWCLISATRIAYSGFGSAATADRRGAPRHPHVGSVTPHKPRGWSSRSTRRELMSPPWDGFRPSRNAAHDSRPRDLSPPQRP